MPTSSTSSCLLTLLTLALAISHALADNELVEGWTKEDFELARTFDGFNSTTLLAVVAVGALLVLLIGVGLYLYDYYSDNSKTDPYNTYDYAGYYQDQYQNAQQAYPNAQQVYRYASQECGLVRKRITHIGKVSLSLASIFTCSRPLAHYKAAISRIKHGDRPLLFVSIRPSTSFLELPSVFRLG